MKRDEKGRFIKGNKEGNRFKTRPPNSGQKPSRFKLINEEISKHGGEPLSKEDLSKSIVAMLSLNKDELKKIAMDSETPMMVVIIANAIVGDIESKQLSNVERLLDRVFGKSTQPIESEVNATISNGVNLDNLTLEELKQYHALIEKTNAKKEE